MIGVLIIIGVGVFINLFLAFLASVTKLQDGRYQWAHRLTKKGIIYWVLGGIYIALAICQYIITDKEQKSRDEALTITYNKSVDNIKGVYEAKSDTTTMRIIRALAVYNLKYDSVQRRIETKMNASSFPLPSLQLLDKDGSVGWKFVEKNVFKYTFTAKQGTCVKAKVLVSSAFSDTTDFHTVNDLSYGGKVYLLDDGKVDEGTYLDNLIRIRNSHSWRYMFCWIRGNYQTIDRKVVPFEEAICYRFDDNYTLIISHDLKVNVINFFKKSENKGKK